MAVHVTLTGGFLNDITMWRDNIEVYVKVEQVMPVNGQYHFVLNDGTAYLYRAAVRRNMHESAKFIMDNQGGKCLIHIRSAEVQNGNWLVLKSFDLLLGASVLFGVPAAQIEAIRARDEPVILVENEEEMPARPGAAVAGWRVVALGQQQQEEAVRVRERQQPARPGADGADNRAGPSGMQPQRQPVRNADVFDVPRPPRVLDTSIPHAVEGRVSRVNIGPSSSYKNCILTHLDGTSVSVSTYSTDIPRFPPEAGHYVRLTNVMAKTSKYMFDGHPIDQYLYVRVSRLEFVDVDDEDDDDDVFVVNDVQQ